MPSQEDIDAANAQEADNWRKRALDAERQLKERETDHSNQRAVIDNLKERLGEIRDKTDLSNE